VSVVVAVAVAPVALVEAHSDGATWPVEQVQRRLRMYCALCSRLTRHRRIICSNYYVSCQILSGTKRNACL
ncbi:MAG TPA: hypothetical protein VGM01_02465, partial [Ktedonobacteraceae bacterium]